MFWNVFSHLCYNEKCGKKAISEEKVVTLLKFYIRFWIKCFLNGNFYISLNTTLLYKCVWLIILIQGFKALWISISQLRKRLEKFLVVDFLYVVFAQIAFSLNAFYVKKKVFIFSHTSHVLATFAKTSDMIVNNNIKVFFNMRIFFTTPSCLSLHHPIQGLGSSKAEIKPITNISLLSILWAFLMLIPTINAEALANGDNHLTRSKIFEEKGNLSISLQLLVLSKLKFNITVILSFYGLFSVNVGVYIYHVELTPTYCSHVLLLSKA